MRASTSCRFCRYWLEGDYAADPDGTIRRIGQGCCDACGRARLRAAEEFIRASDAVRVLQRAGIEPDEIALLRVRYAEDIATNRRVLAVRRQPENWIPAKYRDPERKRDSAC